jgi:hypothetical protein
MGGVLRRRRVRVRFCRNRTGATARRVPRRRHIPCRREDISFNGFAQAFDALAKK